MIVFLLVRTAHDELGRGRCPNRGVLAGLAVPGGVLLADEPAGLVLEPVQRPSQDGSPLVPDDLLVVLEANAQQSVENLAGELRSVPDVSDLETRQQFE